MAWVRIPKSEVEYFHKHFRLNKIGRKIGRVIKLDSTTANVEKRQFTRLCVEVDLTKLLLSRFRLNGKIWTIQYEGLKMICFTCGKQGHREDNCPLNAPTADTGDNVEQPAQTNPNTPKQPAEQAPCGSWTMVRKPR